VLRRIGALPISIALIRAARFAPDGIITLLQGRHFAFRERKKAEGMTAFQAGNAFKKKNVAAKVAVENFHFFTTLKAEPFSVIGRDSPEYKLMHAAQCITDAPNAIGAGDVWGQRF
jgi:hypothetical protein